MDPNEYLPKKSRLTTDTHDINYPASEKSGSASAADQLRVYRYPPTTLPQSVFSTQLSWKEAQRKLIESTKEVLGEVECRKSWREIISKIYKLDSVNIRFLVVENFTSLLIGIMLLSVPFPDDLIPKESQLKIEARDMKIGGGVMISSAILNMIIVLADFKSKITRNIRSLEIAIESLKTCTISTEVEAPIPRSTESVSLTRVLRDQKVYDCPTCLIVEGDILLVFVCETLPCNARILNRKDIRGSAADNPEVQVPIFEKGEKLTINRLKEVVKCHSAYASMSLDAPCYYFRALETPVIPVLKKMLNSYSQDAVIDTQVRVFRTFCFSCLLVVVLISVITVIVLSFTLIPDTAYGRPYVLIVLSLSRAILFIPHIQLPITILLYASRLYGNANLLSLLDGLQNSKKAFEEDTGIDEFDAAPPPTKRLATNWLLVLKNVFLQLVQKNFSIPIIKGRNIADSLAHITLITAADREGTIADTFPRPKQMFFFGDNQELISVDSPSSGEQSGSSIAELKEHTGKMNSIGMSILMSTQCNEKFSNKIMHSHVKSGQLSVCGKVSPAHQYCPCMIGHLLPKLRSFARGFVHKKSFCIYEPSFSDVYERSGVAASAYYNLYKNVSQNSFHAFAETSLPLSTEICDRYWYDENLLRFTPELKIKLKEMYYNVLNNNLQAVAYTYKPIDADVMQLQFINYHNESILCNLLKCSTDSKSQTSNAPRQLLHKDKKASRKKTAYINKKPTFFSSRDQVDKLAYNHVFLGFQTFSQIPKPNMVDFIEDMRLAGIRFVYFSPYPQRESKAFAELLGLETDWNSCIVLSSVCEDSTAYCDPQDMNAHLPRGIENIRNHIDKIDDIPLLVPLFAESTPSAIRDMIRIFQEHDEIVCCIGCSLNEENLETFSVADVSIAFSPFDKEVNQTEIDKKLVTPFEFASTLITLPCVMTLNSNTSIYAISQMIRDSRTLISNSRRGFIFHVGSMFSLSLLLYFSHIFGIPWVFGTCNFYWISLGLSPLLAFFLIFTPHSSEVMTTIPNKRFRSLDNKKTVLLHFFMRFTVPIMSLLGFMITMKLIKACYKVVNTGPEGSTDKFQRISDSESDEQLSKILSVILWVTYTITSGLLFMFEFESFLPLSFLKNKIFCFFGAVMIVVHSLLAWVEVKKLDTNIEMSAWLVLGLFIIISFCLNILLYTLSIRLERQAHRITQKRRRLEIDTKLGMYSPR